MNRRFLLPGLAAAALVMLLSASGAQAGLFTKGCCEPACCEPACCEPECCEPECCEACN